MDDGIGPLFEALAEIGSEAIPDSRSPKWPQWGCAIVAVAIFVAILAALIWSR